MGNLFEANVHIATFNNLTDLEVIELSSSTVYATAWAMLKRQGGRGILTISSQRKFIFAP
jgi:hypothetical protein